jgi:hypothetical protein
MKAADVAFSILISRMNPTNMILVFLLGLVNTRSAPIEEEGGAVKTNSTNLLLGITFIL